MTSDLVERLTKIADASRRANGTDIPLGKEVRAAADEITTLRKRVEDLEAGLRAVLADEPITVHVGYDAGVGGGNYIYADAVRTDSEAFARARSLLSDKDQTNG